MDHHRYQQPLFPWAGLQRHTLELCVREGEDVACRPHLPVIRQVRNHPPGFRQGQQGPVLGSITAPTPGKDTETRNNGSAAASTAARWRPFGFLTDPRCAREPEVGRRQYGRAFARWCPGEHHDVEEEVLGGQRCCWVHRQEDLRPQMAGGHGGPGDAIRGCIFARPPQRCGGARHPNGRQQRRPAAAETQASNDEDDCLRGCGPREAHRGDAGLARWRLCWTHPVGAGWGPGSPELQGL
mmetsp:Transcript_42867/g.96640  ORF Transcript_42867/g.96640 Transcript_42867/m.96640 type:complete len:240 (+) Transcript_42867:124-843(+)